METLKRWQDLEYQFRNALCIEHYVQIDQPLYFFRQHGGERISSQYDQQQGIEAGFESLAAVERILTSIDHRDPDVDLELSKFYVTLAELAAGNGERDALSKAVHGATRNRRGRAFRIRMWIFQSNANTLGGRVALGCASLYKRTTVIKR